MAKKKRKQEKNVRRAKRTSTHRARRRSKKIMLAPRRVTNIQFMLIRALLVLIGLALVTAATLTILVMFDIQLPFIENITASLRDQLQSYSARLSSSFVQLAGFVLFSILALIIAFFSFRHWYAQRAHPKKVRHSHIVLAKSETDIDAFYTYVQTKKQAPIEESALFFGVSTELAEEWARILESKNLVKISYSSLGSLVITIPKEAEKHGA